MKLLRRHSTPPTPTPSTKPGGVEFAWRVHEAIQGWTATVDIKASVVVAVEAAVTGVAARGLITQHGELHGSIGLHLATAITALVTLAAAVGCGLWVVFPRLEHTKTASATYAGAGLIYFGHLRTREPQDIADSLRRLTPDEERVQLARQLIITSDVAWRKHVWLQRSLGLFAIGTGLLVISFVAF